MQSTSHTDSKGSHDYNQNLSQRRANTVVKYIISNGISPNRIYGKGYGETRLVNDCKNGIKCTKGEHQLNRRTEFLIIPKKQEYKVNCFFLSFHHIKTVSFP